MTNHCVRARTLSKNWLSAGANCFEGRSMGKIAKKLDRSAASVHAQIHTHDQAVEKFGFCVKCRRMNGKYGLKRQTEA